MDLFGRSAKLGAARRMQIKKESEQGKILSLRLDYVHCYKLYKTVSISLNVSTPSTVYILFVLSIVLNLLPLLA